MAISPNTVEDSAVGRCSEQGGSMLVYHADASELSRCIFPHCPECCTVSILQHKRGPHKAVSYSIKCKEGSKTLIVNGPVRMSDVN
jgi:hypothetical protein